MADKRTLSIALLVCFGFLMLLRSAGILSGEPIEDGTIKALLFAEFAVAAALNEWMVLGGGLGMSLVLTTALQRSQPIGSDGTSDRLSMLGSMVLSQHQT